MVTKDVIIKINSEWSRYKKPISEISKTGQGLPLVDSDILMFNYDEISKSIHKNKKIPTSTDALYLSEKSIEFIEFKSGFKQRLSKDYDKNKAKCEKIDEVCEEYWKLYDSNREKVKNELINSIKLKAIESYMTFDKHILMTCQEANNRSKIIVKLKIVIDENETDNMEKALSELAEKSLPDTNCFARIENMLDRLHVKEDAEGRQYYFDEIKVVSVTTFSDLIKAGNYR